MAFTSQQKNGLFGAIAALAIGVFALQHFIDPLRMQPAIEPPKKGEAIKGLNVNGQAATLPFEYSLGALTGFRQVIAGLLWVRTDEFFHSGNYDAILPMIRLITWLDPNWLDVYATGAWHMMYNFTDTDQRSDRRYLGPGMALLNEGIENNPDVYDIYKEKGWNSFDKLKDYDLAVEALQGGEKTKNYDVTQVGHLLAHSLERSGRIDDSIAQWNKNMDDHKARMNAKDVTSDEKGRNESGYRSSKNNYDLMLVRKEVRTKDTQPPIDAQFTCKITRTSSKVLKIEGSWICYGTAGKSFDAGTPEHPGKGILISGPTDGARVDVRLQDAGYVPPVQKTFSFDIDQSVTLMQDQISTRDGKVAHKGELFIDGGKSATTAGRPDENTNVFQFTDADVVKYKMGNVPLSKGLGQLTPMGRLQAVSIAYPLPYQSKEILYTPDEVAVKFAELQKDTAKLAELDKKNYRVSQAQVDKPGVYSRTIDMSKDPSMYSFSRDKYELILSINPRNMPDNIQDRYGWSGEGLTDKNYLFVDPTKHNLRMIRRVITLTKDDLTGAGEKVLVEK